MQKYGKYPDLRSLLQSGNYAVNMQQHAATCAFLVEKSLLLVSNTKISLNFQKLCTTKAPFTNYLICCILNWYAAIKQHYAANAATIFLTIFFRIPTSNLTFMRSFMQIYSKYPNLGSMLQLGDYAVYMQQYAAT